MVGVRVAGVTSVLCLGYLWFLIGIVWIPTNKLYQQGLVVLLWLPALAAAVLWRERLTAAWRSEKLLLWLVLLLLVWAGLSVTWTEAGEPLRELKRVLYVGLFLGSFVLLALERPAFVWKGLGLAFVLLALSCPISIYLFYGLDTHPLHARLRGIGQAGHPILGAYVMALAVVWGLQCLPRIGWQRIVWGALLAMLMLFIALGQSRGAMLALGLAAISMPFWGGGRGGWLVFLSACLIALGGFFFFAPFILERGLSHRPDIFWSSVDMISAKPWLGLGIGADYRVVTAHFPRGADHSHNVFTHAAIELGMPGLVLWAALWLTAFKVAWGARHSREGRILLSSLLVSFVAQQFDAASLWGSPRAEWFVTWLPIGLAMALAIQRGRLDVHGVTRRP
ncbi:polymerase [Stutzerimonas frequens]|uniref:O-antigen ligase family protein n=1 Tax=Stutzerimonas frequens TaxID=2968969 RepID=A0ABX6XW78_9GAMM|nr:O-antigen ligase family protein [Stutzerimonas frequens]MCQ4304145.1 O-antigen ligase family protein [Stutzerimonas frequens]PNF51841.1 polymerase [Stutzerimonas frequens]QPT18324.1 O-antigen ligase family protein [Stutzerimonas frequens]